MVLTGVPDWMLDSPCSMRPDLDWFDLDCGLQQAVAICHKCELTTKCLDYAIEHRLVDGIWGGLWGQQLELMITRRGR